jgi:hypothetical protein
MHVYIADAKSIDIGNLVDRGNIVRVSDKDANNGSIKFSIMDLKTDTRYYLEILAYDQKNVLIDRSYLSFETKNKKEFFEIKTVSGLWTFDKPAAFNLAYADSAYYDGVYIAAVPILKNTVTHECFLYNALKKTKLQDMSFFYENGKFRAVPIFENVPVKRNDPIRVIAFDIRKTLTSAGVMADRSFFNELDNILFSPWEFKETNKAKFYLIECIPREVIDRRIVKNTPFDITAAVKDMEKLMIKGEFTKNKGIYRASGVSMIVFASSCIKTYKAFCHQNNEKEIEITVDVGDLYIHPVSATKKKEVR